MNNRRGNGPPMGRGGPFDGGRGGGGPGRGGFGPGRGGGRGGPMMNPDFGGGPMGGGGGRGGNGGRMSHYGPAASMGRGMQGPGGPPHNMMGRGSPGRGGGPMMGPGGRGGGGPNMNRYGPQGGNFSPGMQHNRHPNNGGPGPGMMPPHMMGRDNRGGPPPPPPPPRGMSPGGNRGGHNMMGPGGGPGGYNNQQGPPPPPPPPMNMRHNDGHHRPNQMNNMQHGPGGPNNNMMGQHNPNQPPFHNNHGPPQHHHHHMHNMNPQMHNMSQGPPPPPPGPPGMHPNQQQQQQMHPNQNQPPFHGGPPNNNMMRPPNNQQQQPPFEQGYPQHPMQQQMGQQGQQPPPNMAPQHPQYQQQQHPPPMHNMQQQHQQPPPGMPPQYPNQAMMQQSPQQQQGFLRNNPQNMQQQQQPPRASPSTPAGGGVKNAESAWTEHKSPAGVAYFYNTVTGVSTYDRPAALPASSAAGGVAAAATTISPNKPQASAPANTTAKSKWQTYTDENTGKKYYSDGVTTTWNRPPDLPPDETDSEITKKAQTKRGVSFEEDTSRKSKKKKTDKGGSNNKSTENTQPLYSNKAEAIAAFKGLLLAKDISPTTKWNDVLRICSSDTRWEACTTVGERKQALAEYQTKRANELRDVKRQEKVRAKEAFQRLLTDVLPASAKFTPGTSRFMDVRDLLSKDDRFYAVEDETAREELFYEWVEELRKKEERSKRNKRREAKEGCLKFLKGKEEEGRLTFASTWSSFLSSLTDAETSDLRFTISTHMSETDRQLYFSDYVIELQNAEDEKRRRIRDARRRAEKAQRDAFRERLVELAKTGVITPESRWRGVEDTVSSDATYEPIVAQGREVGREMFEDFVYDWKEEWRRDRVTLMRVWEMSKKEFVFGNNNGKGDKEEGGGVEAFGKMLLESSAGSPDLYGEIRRISNRESPMSSVALFYKELRADSEVSKNGSGKNKRGSLSTGNGDESSEDEGEIIEDGEEKEDA